MKGRLVRFLPAVATLTLVLASCATIHSVRPLSQGERQLDASLGGPLVTNLGVPMPIPLVSVNYLYGLTNDVSVGGTAYVTDALFGTGHIEANGIVGLFNQKGAVPALSLEANLHAITDFRTSVQFFPELNLTPSWELGDFLLYGGAGAMFNLYPDMADGTKRRYLAIPDFYLGASWIWSNWLFTAELKYLNPFQRSYPAAPGYVGIGEWGALAPFLQASFRFGGGK